MKTIFTAIFLAVGFFAFGQTTVELTEDLVLSETLLITEDVTYNGNGFKIICQDCSPAIRVENGARVHFQDVFFPRVYNRWLSIEGGDMTNVTWDSSKMKGYIRDRND